MRNIVFFKKKKNNKDNTTLRDCYRPYNLDEYLLTEYSRILKRFRVIKKKINPNRHLSREILEALSKSDWDYLKELIISSKYE